MKYILICCLLIPACLLAQQAPIKKPTLMVVPSDPWCKLHGYTMEFQDENRTRTISDYRQAVESDLDLIPVIAKINSILAKYQFPAKALDQELKSLEFDEALDAVGTSRDGSSVYESPIDQLLKRAQSDIILQLTWKVVKVGPKNSINFTIRGLDAYSNKEVATISGNGSPSFESSVPLLLEEAVVKDMDNFMDNLERHFQDMDKFGREITLRVRVWDSWGEDLYTEVGDEELGMVIEDWLADNCVGGRFSTTNHTETYMYFEQVRMPLWDDRGRAIDARRWARDLQKHLRGAPYNIPVRLDSRGLGQATLTLGSK